MASTVHAAHTFDQVEAEGPAARPLDFPPPRVSRGVRVNALVVHPTTGLRDILPGVIHRESYTNGERSLQNDSVDAKDKQSPEPSRDAKLRNDTHDDKEQSTNSNDLKQIKSTSQQQSSKSHSAGTKSTVKSSSSTNRDDYIAYFPQRRLQDAIYGSVWACLVLKRHFGPAADDAAQAAGVRPGDPKAPIVWEIVGRHVAIKMIEWSKVHQSRGRLLEDPVKEIAAMQLIGTQHPNVLGSMEVLQDDDFLFSIMPYAKGGDLFGYVVRDTELRGGEGGMSEPVARYWFRQLLDVSLLPLLMDFLLLESDAF
jgi:hypothetical protein